MSTQLNINSTLYYKKSNPTSLINPTQINQDRFQKPESNPKFLSPSKGYRNSNNSKNTHPFNKNKKNKFNQDSSSPNNNNKRQRLNSTNSNITTDNSSNSQTPKSSIDITNEKRTKQNKNQRKNSVQLRESKEIKSYYNCNNQIRKYSEDIINYNYNYNYNYYNCYTNQCGNGTNTKADDFKIKYKTELCKYYEINGTCKFGDNCAYAHGKENLREKITKTSAYRTKKCIQFFDNGFCPYGNRCQFSHEIRPMINLNDSNINHKHAEITYSKMLDLLSNVETIEKTDFPYKRRLQIFEEITKSENNNNETLLDDIKNFINDPIYKDIEHDINNKSNNLDFDKFNLLNYENDIIYNDLEKKLVIGLDL